METTLSDSSSLSKYKVKLPQLHLGQIDVAKSNSRFKVLVAGRRWGKTRLGVWLCIAKAMQGKKTWWVAPTYSMAMEGWKEIRKLGIDYGCTVKEYEKTLYTPTGGFVTVRSADNPDRLRGAGLDYIVLDECAYIKEATWKVVLYLSQRLRVIIGLLRYMMRLGKTKIGKGGKNQQAPIR